MAVNFGILAQTPSIGARYAEGLQLAQAEQERNMLRQQQMAQLAMQRENMLAQRADREAQRGEREAQARLRGQQELELKARMERAAREEGYLNKVSELFANNGMPLNLKTAQEGLSYAIKSGDKSAIDMMNRTVASLQEREALQAAFGGQAAPAAAPANALAAPPQPTAPAGGMSRQQLQDIILNPNAPPAAVERAKAVLAALPKEPTPRASQLMTPEEEAQRIRIARESRPPAQPREPREPAAPTVTQIQDPADPSRMLTIDARRYAGGSVGAPGVIGTSGKTAPAAAAEQKKVAAQNELQNVIDTLKTAYADLDAMRAVPSEQRNVISNALSYIASTGPGQVAGRIGGTAAQTQRDVIQSSRNLLFTAVKNATGKTSGELNSNVEFKTWLEALTDPSRSIQANQAILENLEKFVASGGNYSARKSAGEVKPAPGAPPRAPAAGASPYQNLSNEELLRQLGVKPGGR